MHSEPKFKDRPRGYPRHAGPRKKEAGFGKFKVCSLFFVQTAAGNKRRVDKARSRTAEASRRSRRLKILAKFNRKAKRLAVTNVAPTQSYVSTTKGMTPGKSKRHAHSSHREKAKMQPRR